MSDWLISSHMHPTPPSSGKQIEVGDSFLPQIHPAPISKVGQWYMEAPTIRGGVILQKNNNQKKKAVVIRNMNEYCTRMKAKCLQFRVIDTIQKNLTKKLNPKCIRLGHIPSLEPFLEFLG